MLAFSCSHEAVFHHFCIDYRKLNRHDLAEKSSKVSAEFSKEGKLTLSPAGEELVCSADMCTSVPQCSSFDSLVSPNLKQLHCSLWSAKCNSQLRLQGAVPPYHFYLVVFGESKNGLVKYEFREA